MKRLMQCFNNLKNTGQKALIPYITAGDPNLNVTLSLMKTLVECGADILEIGVPFSEPVADGLTIQKAHQRSLQNGTTLVQVLEMVKQFRKEDTKTPVVLMSYVNPIETLGYGRFAQLAMEAQVDGLLIIDLPPEESDDIFPELTQFGLECIYLASPTTSDERLALINQFCQGYLYYVSVKGVTGSQHLNMTDIKQKVDHVRKFIELPVCVGFGVNDAKTAYEIAQIADGVIIGSAIVKHIEENINNPQKIIEQIKSFTTGIRQALDTI